MRTTDRDRLQVLRRVRDFLQPMANEPKLAIAYAELEGLVERMEKEGGRQDLHERRARRGTDEVLVLARTLREDLLRPVAQLVRSVAPDAAANGLPGSKALTLPKSRNQQGLLNAANGFHDMAKPYEDRLAAAGLPAGHLAELQRGAAALKAAIDVRAQDYLQRSSAASAAKSDGRRAVQLLRLLHSLVAPMLRDDAGRFRAWTQARRLPRRVASVDLPTSSVTPTIPLTPVAPAAPVTPVPPPPPVVATPNAVATPAPTNPTPTAPAPAKEVNKAA